MTAIKELNQMQSTDHVAPLIVPPSVATMEATAKKP